MIHVKNDTQWIGGFERRRAQIGLSKADLARRSGVSLPTVNRFLAGKEPRPSVQVVQAIANSLGLQVQLGAAIEVIAPLDPAAFRAQEALAKAERLMRLVQGSLALEAQGVSEAEREALKQQTVHELLAGSPRRLWSDA